MFAITWNLRTKFFAGSLIILLAAGLLFSLLYYRHLKGILMKEALRKSELILQEVEATRDYVEQVLRPRVRKLQGDEAFIIEAMSTTYVSLNIMKRFRDKMPGYEYRRVSLNPHNPENLANDHEEEMFDWFEANPDRHFWQGLVKRGGAPFFVSMTPDYVDRGCLRCHGSPDDAPRPLLQQYGKDGGFRFAEGDLIGLNSVSVPVSKPLAAIRKASAGTFLVTVVLTGALLFLINLFFGRLVVARLAQTIGFVAEDDGSDGATDAVAPMPTQDELDALRQSVGRLNRYVMIARKGAAMGPNFLGPYSVGMPIAAGTLSWLHQGRDTRRDRKITVKYPFHDVLLNPLYATCVRMEVRLFEQLRHPGLLGAIAREGDVLILEPTEAGTLESIMKKGALSGTQELLAIGEALCDLVGYLHNAGVVHHDLRPANILAAADGSLKLFDLGLSSWRDAPDTILEAGVGPQGDPKYMAPEQLAGKRGDPRSDIYTLGLLLGAVATGEWPVDAHRSNWNGWLGFEERRFPSRPSIKSLSAEIQTVLMQAMAPSPEERYQWVEDFWNDLRAAASG